MLSFEEFLKSLGDFANNYTPDELRQLHLDVQRLAQVIVGIQRAKERQRTTASPQERLDADRTDRTFESSSTSK